MKRKANLPCRTASDEGMEQDTEARGDDSHRPNSLSETGHLRLEDNKIIFMSERNAPTLAGETPMHVLPARKYLPWSLCWSKGNWRTGRGRQRGRHGCQSGGLFHSAPAIKQPKGVSAQAVGEAGKCFNVAARLYKQTGEDGGGRHRANSSASALPQQPNPCVRSPGKAVASKSSKKKEMLFFWKALAGTGEKRKHGNSEIARLPTGDEPWWPAQTRSMLRQKGGDKERDKPACVLGRLLLGDFQCSLQPKPD